MNLQTMACIDLRGSSQRGPSTERRTDVGSPRGELTPTGKGKSASSRGVLLLISIRHHPRSGGQHKINSKDFGGGKV